MTGTFYFLQNCLKLESLPHFERLSAENEEENKLFVIFMALSTALLGVSEKSPVLKVVTNASFCFPPLRDTPLTHLPSWTVDIMRIKWIKQNLNKI